MFGSYLRRNLLASQRVFEAAVRDEVKVVFSSSSSIYRRGPGCTDADVLRGASAVADAITNSPGRISPPPMAVSCVWICVVLLDSNALAVSGPKMAFTRIAFALATGGMFELYGDGDQSRGGPYASDVVDATVAAMERGNGTYNVGGNIEASMTESIDLVPGDRRSPTRSSPPAGGSGRPATHECRHDADSRGARLAAACLSAERP